MGTQYENSSNLITAIDNAPHTFLQPNQPLYAAAVAEIKAILDPLANDVISLQSQRRQEYRKKRKRADLEQEEPLLQIRQVYTNGLGAKQIWEQAKRVFEATCAEIEREVTLQEGVNNHVEEPIANGSLSSSDSKDEQHSFLSTSSSDRQARTLIESRQNYGIQNKSLHEEADRIMEELESAEDIMDDDDDDSMFSAKDVRDEIYVPDPNGLNDGFFSIDDFNKQSQFLEQHDARGEEDNPSDEDDIDWDADPLSMPIAQSRSKNRDEVASDLDIDNDQEDYDDEGGPTFGDADINEVDSDDSLGDDDQNVLDDLPGLHNTNDISYADFFEPPAKKSTERLPKRPLPKTQPPKDSVAAGNDVEDGLQRAIADVRRDLLDSDEEIVAGSDSDDEKQQSNDKNMSTHEKQKAKIAAEIRRLEAASVAKKDWTLSGEAHAGDRPLNSLLEEDLDFERTGKPVPVITAEVSEEIEELIKRRILAREFDEVIRRRPDSIGVQPDTRRGQVEINDRKSQTGLAEIYEEEHLKRTDAGYVDERSSATKKQHEEISRLWKEVSSQLDQLTNLHFKPKRVEIQMKAVKDKPVISMEDARPVGAGGEESMLAPQEVYKPGENGKVRDEVIRKSGANVNKEEMTREEKLRKRRREKERMKKAKGNASGEVKDSGAKQVRKSKSEEKQDIFDDLRKGNVKVIGKGGELQDLGKQKRVGGETKSISALKL